MAKFLDSKERVLDLRLTSYGKYLLSVGKFKPHSYAFFDDNVIYDGEYANIVEPQNAIHNRIKKETPYLESLVLFEEVEKPSEIKEDPAISAAGPGNESEQRISLAETWFDGMTEYAQSYKVLGYGPGDLAERSPDDPAYVFSEILSTMEETSAVAAEGVGILDVSAVAAGSADDLATRAKQVPVVKFFQGDVFPTEYLPRKDIFKIEQAIGDAAMSSDQIDSAPAWKIMVLNGRIKFLKEKKAKMAITFQPIGGGYSGPTTGQRFTLTDIDAGTCVFEFVNSSTTTYSRDGSTGRVRVSKRDLSSSLELVERLATGITGANQEGLIKINVLGTFEDPSSGAALILLEQYRGGARGNIDHTATLSGISGVQMFEALHQNKFSGGTDREVDITEKDLTFPSSSLSIPQVNIEVDYKKSIYSIDNLSMQFDDPNDVNNRSGVFLDDKYVQLTSENPMIYVDEVNTEMMNKNFDIEVFMITGSSDNIGYNDDGVWGHIEPTYQLIRKYFAEPKDQIVDGTMTTNHPYDYDNPEIDMTSVEYYFSLMKDSDTNKKIACREIQEYNKSSYYIDLGFDCEDDQKERLYNDIYGSEVEPEICLD